MNELPPNISSFSDQPSPEAPAPPIPSFRPIRTEDETTIFLPDTPNTSQDYTPRRIPHLGHAFLFVAFAFLLLLFVQAVVLGFAHPVLDAHKNVTAVLHPKLIVASEMLAEGLTLLAAFFFFPLLWHRTFSEGIQWNFAAARRNLLKLIGVGLILGWTVQAISSLIPMPKSIPMDNFFHTPSDVWLVTLFGTLLAPVFEEI